MRIAVSHFKETFRGRFGEWLFAVIMMGIGLALSHTDLTHIAQYFGTLFVHCPSWLLATLLTMTGGVRLIALTINGMWKRTPYVRMAMAVVAGFFWAEIALGILFSGIISLGWATYPFFALAEVYLAFCAADDARAGRRKIFMGSGKSAGKIDGST